MRGTCVYLASLLASAAVGGPLPLLSPSQSEPLDITARDQTQDFDIYLTLATSILSHCPQGPSPERWQKLAGTFPGGPPDDLKGGGGAVTLRRDNDDGDVSPPENRRMHGAEGLKLLDLALRSMAYCANMPFPECWRRLEAAYPGVPGDFHERIAAVPGAGGVKMQDDPGAGDPGADDGPGDDDPEDDSPQDDPPKNDAPKDDSPEDDTPKTDPPEASPPEPSAPAAVPPKISPPKIVPPRIDLIEVAPPVFSPPETTNPADCGEPPSRYDGITLVVRSLRHCPGSGMPFRECWALLRKAMPGLPAEFEPRRAVTTGSFFVSDVEDFDRRGRVV